MANLIIQENGVVRTRPAVTGEEITIKTPCSCSDVTGVQINGVVFPFYDAMGNILGKTAGLFNKDSLIRVLIDADKTRAYILNADTNAYLEGKLAEKYSPDNKPSLEDLGAAGKSTTVTATLAAASWTGSSAPYSYTLSVSGVTTTSNQEILPAVNITEEQLEALQAANIQDGGQTAGNITLKAFGDVPTIDIPIRVIKRGD